MANKYSYYLMRLARQQGVIASLYTDAKDPEAFSAGYIEAVTQRHVLQWLVTPWGQPDGWLLCRTDDVLQVYMGDDHELRLQMLLDMAGKKPKRLFSDLKEGEEGDLLARVLQKVKRSREVISLAAGEETFAGRVVLLDDLRVTLAFFDFYGSEEGKRQIPLRDIAMLTLRTAEEKMFDRLNKSTLHMFEG